MKKYLKIGSILLALLLVVSFAACGGGSNDENYDETPIVDDGDSFDAVEPDETEDPFAEDTEDEGEAPAEVELSTPKGYLTITARDGWVEGEALANDRLVLENPDLGVVVTITIDDFQLVSDIEQEKSIIASGYEAKEFTEYTIGDNTFERLQVSDTLNYLVTTCSTGKVIQLEIRNCALEDAESVLETIVIG